MRVTATTNVTLDGVMQGLGGPDEDRRGGFERGGWALPLVDAETGEYLNEIYGNASAFLFGRRTYEIFAGSWGSIPDMQASPIGMALNSRPKYVVSSTLGEPRWEGTRVLSGDLAAAIRDLKAQGEGDVLVPGSGVLLRWLLANGLVDQFDLVIYPVIAGQGRRLFPDAGPDSALDLVKFETTSKGIAIMTFRPNGRPLYAGEPAAPVLPASVRT